MKRGTHRHAAAAPVFLVLASLVAPPPDGFAAGLGVGPDIASAQVAASTLEGHWVGGAQGPGGILPVELELTGDEASLSGAVILPAEGNFRAEADSISLDGNRMVVATMDGQLTLDVRVGDEVIEGSIRSPGGTMDVRLARAGTPMADEIQEEIRRDIQAMRATMTLELEKEGPGVDRVDSEALRRLVEEAESALTTSMVVLHDGDLVAEWHDSHGPRKVQAMSVTKVALHLAVGRLLTSGRLESIDEPVHKYFPEWSEGPHARVTIRHLLSHTSGLPPGVPTGDIYQAPDVVRYALDLPIEDAPGTAKRYSNNGTNLLAGVIERIAGEPLDAFLRGDLFSRLGINDFDWTRDRAGNPHGMAGLAIHARDLARLGQLALDRGMWKGEELIHASWFDESFHPGAPGAEGGDILEGREHRVGLIWFLEREDAYEEGDGRGEVVGASHSGHLGQWLVAYPGERLVGVRMIQGSPAYDPESDAFRTFVERVRELGR